MTEKKQETTKKTTARKAAVKKETPKVEAEKAKVETKKAPARAKRVQVDRNELIPCRSATTGTLVYISDRTRAKFIWRDFGTVQYVEMGELLDMRASHPAFLNDVQLIIEDEDAIEVLGLVNVYDSLTDFDGLDELFLKSASDLAELLPNLPKGVKRSLGNRARAMIESGELESLNVIKVLEDALKVDLKMFTD